MEKTINDPRIEIKAMEGFRGDPSPVSDTNSSGYRTTEQSIRQVFPEVIVAPGLVLAATDSRHYIPLARNVYRFSPIRLSPEDLPRIHGTDERISVEDYTRVVLFYTQFIRNAESVQ
jgi:carboxypeptidase PM20D1